MSAGWHDFCYSQPTMTSSAGLWILLSTFLTFAQEVVRPTDPHDVELQLLLQVERAQLSVGTGAAQKRLRDSERLAQIHRAHPYVRELHVIALMESTDLAGHEAVQPLLAELERQLPRRMALSAELGVPQEADDTAMLLARTELRLTKIFAYRVRALVQGTPPPESEWKVFERAHQSTSDALKKRPVTREVRGGETGGAGGTRETKGSGEAVGRNDARGAGTPRSAHIERFREEREKARQSVLGAAEWVKRISELSRPWLDQAWDWGVQALRTWWQRQMTPRPKAKLSHEISAEQKAQFESFKKLIAEHKASLKKLNPDLLEMIRDLKTAVVGVYFPPYDDVYLGARQTDRRAAPWAIGERSDMLVFLNTQSDNNVALTPSGGALAPESFLVAPRWDGWSYRFDEKDVERDSDLELAKYSVTLKSPDLRAPESTEVAALHLDPEVRGSIDDILPRELDELVKKVANKADVEGGARVQALAGAVSMLGKLSRQDTWPKLSGKALLKKIFAGVRFKRGILDSDLSLSSREFAEIFEALVRRMHAAQRIEGLQAMRRVIGFRSRRGIIQNIDAHVWNEMYFTGQGWLVVDPSPRRGAGGESGDEAGGGGDSSLLQGALSKLSFLGALVPNSLIKSYVRNFIANNDLTSLKLPSGIRGGGGGGSWGSGFSSFGDLFGGGPTLGGADPKVLSEQEKIEIRLEVHRKITAANWTWVDILTDLSIRAEVIALGKRASVNGELYSLFTRELGDKPIGLSFDDPGIIPMIQEMAKFLGPRCPGPGSWYGVFLHRLERAYPVLDFRDPKSHEIAAREFKKFSAAIRPAELTVWAENRHQYELAESLMVQGAQPVSHKWLITWAIVGVEGWGGVHHPRTLEFFEKLEGNLPPNTRELHAFALLTRNDPARIVQWGKEHLFEAPTDPDREDWVRFSPAQRSAFAKAGAEYFLKTLGASQPQDTQTLGSPFKNLVDLVRLFREEIPLEDLLRLSEILVRHSVWAEFPQILARVEREAPAKAGGLLLQHVGDTMGAIVRKELLLKKWIDRPGRQKWALQLLRSGELLRRAQESNLDPVEIARVFLDLDLTIEDVILLLEQLKSLAPKTQVRLGAVPLGVINLPVSSHQLGRMVRALEGSLFTEAAASKYLFHAYANLSDFDSCSEVGRAVRAILKAYGWPESLTHLEFFGHERLGVGSFPGACPKEALAVLAEYSEVRKLFGLLLHVGHRERRALIEAAARSQDPKLVPVQAWLIAYADSPTQEALAPKVTPYLVQNKKELLLDQAWQVSIARQVLQSDPVRKGFLAAITPEEACKVALEFCKPAEYREFLKRGPKPLTLEESVPAHSLRALRFSFDQQQSDWISYYEAELPQVLSRFAAGSELTNPPPAGHAMAPQTYSAELHYVLNFLSAGILVDPSLWAWTPEKSRGHLYALGRQVFGGIAADSTPLGPYSGTYARAARYLLRELGAGRWGTESAQDMAFLRDAVSVIDFTTDYAGLQSESPEASLGWKILAERYRFWRGIGFVLAQSGALSGEGVDYVLEVLQGQYNALDLRQELRSLELRLDRAPESRALQIELFVFLAYTLEHESLDAGAWQRLRSLLREEEVAAWFAKASAVSTRVNFLGRVLTEGASRGTEAQLKTFTKTPEAILGAGRNGEIRTLFEETFPSLLSRHLEASGMPATLARQIRGGLPPQEWRHPEALLGALEWMIEVGQNCNFVESSELEAWTQDVAQTLLGDRDPAIVARTMDQLGRAFAPGSRPASKSVLRPAIRAYCAKVRSGATPGVAAQVGEGLAFVSPDVREDTQPAQIRAVIAKVLDRAPPRQLLAEVSRRLPPGDSTQVELDTSERTRVREYFEAWARATERKMNDGGPEVREATRKLPARYREMLKSYEAAFEDSAKPTPEELGLISRFLNSIGMPEVEIEGFDRFKRAGRKR